MSVKEYWRKRDRADFVMLLLCILLAFAAAGPGVLVGLAFLLCRIEDKLTHLINRVEWVDAHGQRIDRPS